MPILHFWFTVFFCCFVFLTDKYWLFSSVLLFFSFFLIFAGGWLNREKRYSMWFSLSLVTLWPYFLSIMCMYFKIWILFKEDHSCFSAQQWPRKAYSLWSPLIKCLLGCLLASKLATAWRQALWPCTLPVELSLHSEKTKFRVVDFHQFVTFHLKLEQLCTLFLLESRSLNSSLKVFLMTIHVSFIRPSLGKLGVTSPSFKESHSSPLDPSAHSMEACFFFLDDR